MVHLIDKDALVAEIKRRKELVSDPILSGDDLMIGERNAFFNLLSFLDTLEVKEVDLNVEEELKKYGISSPKTRDVCIASHFFELGTRVNNPITPITATDRGTAEEIIINLKRVEQDYHINLTKEMEWLRNKVKKVE